MNIYRVLVIVVSLLFISSCQTDFEKINGKWIMVEWTIDGDDMNPTKENYIEFDNDYTIKLFTGGEYEFGTWAIDIDSKSIEMKIRSFGEMIGKYELAGNQLKLDLELKEMNWQYSFKKSK